MSWRMQWKAGEKEYAIYAERNQRSGDLVPFSQLHEINPPGPGYSEFRHTVHHLQVVISVQAGGVISRELVRLMHILNSEYLEWIWGIFAPLE